MRDKSTFQPRSFFRWQLDHFTLRICEKNKIEKMLRIRLRFWSVIQLDGSISDLWPQNSGRHHGSPRDEDDQPAVLIAE